MPAECTATAVVPTASASRYLQQLCKHWSHNMAVEFDETNGRVVFPKNARGGRLARRRPVHDDGDARRFGLPDRGEFAGTARRTQGRGRAPSRPVRVSRVTAGVRLAVGGNLTRR